MVIDILELDQYKRLNLDLDMKRLTLFILFALSPLFAQDQNVNSITFNAPQPPQVTGVSASVASGRPSINTYIYWVVPVYPIGRGPVSRPFMLRNVPDSGTVNVGWNPATGATGYDVLRTTSAINTPTTGCGCALVVNQFSATTSYTDTLGATIAYSVSNFISAVSVTETFDNLNYAVPTLIWPKNILVGIGTVIGDFTGHTVWTDPLSYNTVLGALALTSQTTGHSSTAIGYNSLNANTTGQWNVAVGRQALAVNTIGDSNTSVGSFSLAANISGSYNVAVGLNALLSNTTGYSQIAIGKDALYTSTTAHDIVAIGINALTYTTGSFNVGVGARALQGPVGGASGDSNVAVGDDALGVFTVGSSNTALGNNSLPATTTGSSNVAVGGSAGSTNTTGSQNVWIGGSAGPNAVGLTNAIGIGYAVTNTASNQVEIGNNSITATNLHGAVSLGTQANTPAMQINGVTAFTRSGTELLLASDAFFTKTTISNGILNSGLYSTSTNCSSSASPAVCAAAAAGSVVIAAAATSVVVNTTAVTANSQILIQDDSSLGTKLGVTCNTQALGVLGSPRITARTAATSFTITIDVGPTTNPLCLSYSIIN